MNRRVGILVLFALLISSASAFAQARSTASTSDKWGLLINAKKLLALDGFEDGYQAGAGVKYWIQPKLAARGLVMVEHNTPPEESATPAETSIGLGFAGEWHPNGRAAASPYVGGLAGFRTLTIEGVDETRIDIYLGGMFGVEVKLLQSISCFAEYQLLGAFDNAGFTLSLGTEGSDGSRVLLGLIFYF